jgi:hypothetical protein
MRSSTGRPGGRMIVLLAIPFLVWASCGGDDSFTPSPNPVCALSPDTLDFGTVTIGGHRDLTFTVRNIGTVALNGTIAESCSQYGIVSGGGAFSLGVGDSVVATVRYEPADAGTHACAIATGTIACGSVSCTGEAHSGWEQVYSNAYQGWFDIWGTSASDIWAVGYDIIHFDGIDWTVTTNPSDKRLYGVWGTGPDNVYAVGHDYFTNDGVILRYNGTGWSIVQDDIQDMGFLGVWGSGASDIYAVGLGGNAYHYNGSSWGSFLLGGVVTHAVWGTAANDVFVVGDTGRIQHFNGGTWSDLTSNTSYALLGVWGLSGSEVFVTSFGSLILAYNGSIWQSMQNDGTGSRMEDIWGTAANDIYCVGYGGMIMHFDGTSWKDMGSPTTQALLGIWGSSASNVYAVGDGGVILRYMGP